MNTAYSKYIAALLIFGMNGIVASRIALSSYEIVLMRTLIGSLLLILLFVLTRQKARFLENSKHLLFLVLSGVSMGLSWMFLYEAYRQIGVGMATLANYCGPVIVMVLSPLLFREKLTWAKGLAFLAVLAGMFCINQEVLSGGGSVWGMACGILSAVTYAALVIFNKKAESITGLENAMLQLVASFVTVAAFVGIREGFAFHIEADSWPFILILGLVNTGFGCFLFFSSIGRLPVQTVSICGYLEPLSAVLFSVLFLHETMNWEQLLGAVLILGGAAFGELWRSPSRPSENKKTVPADD